MTTLASDHSTAGAIIGGSLKQAGFGAGILRYAAAGRGNVNITPAEIADLKANGIPIGIVVEHEADWLVRGGVQGRVQGARQITRACGLPDGVLYLAADFDATHWGPTKPGSPGDQTMKQIAANLALAAEAIGRGNVGFYGSYFAIDWLVHNGWGDLKFWQTAAWSQGKLHPAAHVYQRAAAAVVHGVQVDVDVILKPDWGHRAWPAPHPQPKPPTPKPPAPDVIDKAAVTVHLELDQHTKQWKVTGTAVSAA